MDRRIKLYVIGLILLLIVLPTIFSFAYTVKAGERGVLLTFNKASVVAVGEGLHFKIPFVQKVVNIDVKTQKYVAEASSSSRDLQIVSTSIAVNYHLIPETVPTLYTEIGLGYEDRIIQPAVQEVVKAVTARYTAEELITRRADVKNDIHIQLRERLQVRGITVEDISITNFDFSDSFNNAIEAKVTAEQLKLKAVTDLQRIELEALAIRLQRQELSPEFIEFKRLENERFALEQWDGILPKVTGGSTPFVSISEI